MKPTPFNEKYPEVFLVTFATKEGDPKTGPLDLLWSLIRSYEVNILDVSLTKITNDYIQYIRDHESSLNDRSSFTNLAARLLYYKSEKILPATELGEEKTHLDRLSMDIIENLLEYKKIQMAAERLEKSRMVSEHSLSRGSNWHQYEENVDPVEADLVSLLKVFQEYLSRDDRKREATFNIEEEEVILEELYKWLYDRLLRLKKLSFFSILDNCSRIKCIGYFLVILEMARQNKIYIFQKSDKNILLQLK